MNLYGLEYSPIGKVNGIMKGHVFLFKQYSVAMFCTNDNRCFLFSDPEMMACFFRKNFLIYTPTEMTINELFEHITNNEQ